MGNCMELQKQAVWVDEKGLQRRRKVKSGEEEEEEEARRTGRSRTMVTIKIKTSKKKLEELLRQVDGDLEGLRQLLTLWEGQHEKEEEKVVKHWTPELQSIPELPECTSYIDR